MTLEQRLIEAFSKPVIDFAGTGLFRTTRKVLEVLRANTEDKLMIASIDFVLNSLPENIAKVREIDEMRKER